MRLISRSLEGVEGDGAISLLGGGGEMEMLSKEPLSRERANEDENSMEETLWGESLWEGIAEGTLMTVDLWRNCRIIC